MNMSPKVRPLWQRLLLGWELTNRMYVMLFTMIFQNHWKVITKKPDVPDVMGVKETV